MPHTYQRRLWPSAVLGLTVSYLVGCALASAVFYASFSVVGGLLKPENIFEPELYFTLFTTSLPYGLAVVAISAPAWAVLARIRWAGPISAMVLGSCSTALAYAYLVPAGAFPMAAGLAVAMVGALAGWLTWRISYRRVIPADDGRPKAADFN